MTLGAGSAVEVVCKSRPVYKIRSSNQETMMPNVKWYYFRKG